MNANPDFSKFQIASIAGRKRRSNAFLVLCAVTSTVSVVILVVLISSIVLAALPVFGPHTDTLQSDSRVLFVKAGEGDPNELGRGDQLQGIFRVRQLVRGGLGAENDDVYVDDEGNTSQTTIGFFAFQLAEVNDSNIRRLVPATGSNGSVVDVLQELDVDTAGIDLRDASIVLLTSETGSIDFEKLETEGSIHNPKLLDELSRIDDWSLRLAAGAQSDADFAEFLLSDSNKGRLDKIRKTRTRKEAGNLKILSTVLYDRDARIDTYQQIKLRSYITNEINKSQIKIDADKLVGVSRRKKKGFDLGGQFNLQFSNAPEKDASTAKHIAHFLSAKPSDSDPAAAGIGPALWGSIWVCTCCALFALPLGIATAVFLEEFRPTNSVLLALQNLIQLNITNLAGVPSIVYGILGLTAFATMFGIFGSGKEPEIQFGAKHYYQYLSETMEPVLVPVDSPKSAPVLSSNMPATDGDFQPVGLTVIGPDEDAPEDAEALKWTLRSDAEGGLVSEKAWYYFQLPFGRGVLAASLTLMLVILPVIIIASQEAIRAVPSSLRQGAMGLGATRWQVVRNVTLPAAIPGIMTGAILSVSRAIGEAAPIIVLCGTVFIASSPKHLMDFYSVLPIQIFHVTGLPVNEEGQINFQNVAAAASLVLLVVLLTFNTIAIVLRQITSKPLS